MKVERQPVAHGDKVELRLVLAISQHRHGVGEDAVVDERDDGKNFFLVSVFLVFIIVGLDVEPLGLVA